jgi:hypothetical protein
MPPHTRTAFLVPSSYLHRISGTFLIPALHFWYLPPTRTAFLVPSSYPHRISGTFLIPAPHFCTLGGRHIQLRDYVRLRTKAFRLGFPQWACVVDEEGLQLPPDCSSYLSISSALLTALNH